jgi:hypothetical protein
MVLVKMSFGAIILMTAIATIGSERVRPSFRISERAARDTARRFCRAILGENGFSYWDFEGKTRDRMRPLISRRLLLKLDSTRDCARDWASHQPANSTDKPPFVDCCVFSASADWSPTSFVIQKSEPLSDGRRRVTVEYRFDSASEHARWHVALYVTREGVRYVVDDFEGGLDEPRSERWFVLNESRDCRAGKWVAGY